MTSKQVDDLLKLIKSKYKEFEQNNKNCNDIYLFDFDYNVTMICNPSYDSESMCKCGHPYHRHFDPYDRNTFVGCKYCSCDEFVPMPSVEAVSNEMFNVIVESWTEYERGWGSRPDGVSLHRNHTDYKLFLEDYESNKSSYVPDEYSAPNYNPRIIEVSSAIFNLLQENKSKNPTRPGVRLWDSEFKKYSESGEIKI